jgi:Dna[CI] antecedent, DciA
MRGVRPIDSIGTVLNGLARRLGLESKLLECRIRREWTTIVGEPIASNTWLDQIRYKKLYVRVHNTVWLHQLTFLKPALLKKLSSVAGPDLISDIVFRVGELPEAEQVSSSVDLGTQANIPSADLLAEATAHTTAVQDPGLRDRLAHLMAHSLARSKRSRADR